MFADEIAQISERVRPMFEMLRVAAAVEPEVASVYREMEGQRARNMRQATDWIAAKSSLRIPIDRAADIVWALTSPDVARLLCDLQGWSTNDYADWLDDTLTRLLL